MKKGEISAFLRGFGRLMSFTLWFFSVSTLSAQGTASFEVNRTEGCSPLIVVFNNTSTGNIQSCLWNFGNGNSSSECNPVATYTTAGNYEVTLTILAGGQSSTFSKTIRVFPSPVPEFDADLKGGCLPLQVRFTDLTPPTQAPFVSWVWDFGDGRSSGQQNPLQTYLGENSYNVSLIVTDANGCRGATTKNGFITSTSTPKANFTYGDTVACRFPFSISFKNTSESSYPLSYSWDLGNGNTAVGTDAVGAYLSDGRYDVKLTAVNNFGCGASITKPLNIRLETFTPTATFSALSGCAPLSINYSANANLPISQSNWNFGNGQISSASSGLVTFTSPGTYTVRGTFVNAQGCSESITQVIVVHPRPNAKFDATPREACVAPALVQFTSNTPDAVTHRWTFGDGGSSTLQNPSRTYNSNRDFNVTYIATNSFGCADTLLQRSFIKIAPPIVSIAPSAATGCIPHRSDFDLLKQGPGQISLVTWNFGNGNTFIGINPPEQVYNTPGLYPVTAQLTFSDNCPGIQVETLVTTGNKPSISGVVSPTEVCVQRTTVNGNASGGDANTVFTWYFGDGSSYETPIAAHEYNEPGQYPVTLVGSNFGCKDSILISQVTVNPPLANFRTTSLCGGLTLSFRNTSIGSTRSEWDFGDGTKLTDNSAVINHTFPSLGTYRVRLTVFNSATGCSHVIEREVVIDNLRPQLNIPVQTGCAPFMVNLSDSTSRFRTITWDSGDTTIRGNTFKKLYPDPGQYGLNVYTVDDAGCRDTFRFPNVIRVVELQPDFTFDPQGGCAPITVNFRNASTSAFSTINSFTWDFAGLGSSTQRNPSFTFGVNDSMPVRLRVRDNIGCAAVVVKTVPVNIPVADFGSELNSICTNVAFNLKNLSKGVGLQYFWDFGDGISTSDAQDASVVYSGTGTYDISLVVQDANRCSDTIIKPSYVTVENFIYDFDAGPRFKTCPELLTNFEISPADILYNYAFWDFGNGNQSLDSSRFPTNIYVESGKFDVSLFLEDYRGCRDTIVKKEYVEVLGPRGAFTFEPDSGCAPLQVKFTANFINSKENFWDFGDGRGFFDMQLGTSITHTYTEGGISTPSLVLDDGRGCVVLIEGRPIKISGATAIIETDKTGICAGQEVLFKDLSVGQDFAPLVNRRWEISDGAILTDSNFSYQFSADTSTLVYWVKLLVGTDFGCEAADSIPIKVYAYPSIDAGPDQSICRGDAIQLMASGATFYEWSPVNVIANPNQQRPTVAPFNTTLFTVMGYDTLTCPSFDSVLVEVATRFSGVAGPDTVICQGDSIRLFTEVSSVNSGQFVFNWFPEIAISDPQDPNPIVWPEQDLTYTVNIKNGNCSEINYPVFIRVNTKPEVVAGPDQQIFKGQTVRLSANSPQDVRFQWSPEYEISCVSCPFPDVSPRKDITYVVTAIDNAGCLAQDSVSLRVWESCDARNVLIPNTFTPNNDGVNDVFQVRGNGLSNIKLIRIFNRWGEKVFESPDINIGWDGTSNGIPLNSGVYVYYVEAICTDGQSALIKGNVTLLR
jgi:gliding motility-associated-like protein